jgi:arsenite methyltransferase
MSAKDIRESVRAGYGEVARRADEASCCGPGPSSRGEHARGLGYEDIDLGAIPEEANLGLGCGNPSALAALSAGEVVLDLGSGAGMDAFLAAARVGEDGQVIGVDMTPEMLARARDLASQREMSHFVEFRRGYIEDLPVTSESVDVVLSNCVINLSTDKEAVFSEAFRVLKPGGRLAISDICLTAPLPEEVRELAGAYVACISGAMLAADYEAAVAKAGFVDINWTRTEAAALFDSGCVDPVMAEAIDQIGSDTLDEIRENLWSYKFSARKP